MLGWIFGNKKAKHEASVNEKRKAIYDALSPTKRELADLLPEVKEHTAAADLAWQAIVQGDDAELKKLLIGNIIPNVPPSLAERIKSVGKRTAWATPQDILNAGYSTSDSPYDTLYLGWFSHEGGEAILQFWGEGHLLTVAPTGAGKGQGHIIPALLDYPGPAVVLDPKGENYHETAWYRRWCGDVFKWSPFDEDGTDAFNPIDFVENYDDARVLADLAIDASRAKDPFWDNSAKDMLIGLIMYVKKTAEPGRQNMREVYSLLAQPAEKYEEFLTRLKELKDERLTELSHSLKDQPDKLRMSVNQVLRSHLDVWRSPEIERATHTTTEGFSLANAMDKQAAGDIFASLDIGEKQGPHIQYFEGENGEKRGTYVRGQGDSVFIIIPQDKIRSYAGVLRVILGTMINEVTKAVAESNAKRKERERNGESAPTQETPILFLLDELPQLGYMDIIERTAPIARSSRIRLWLFTQSLDQLTQTYPQAHSLVSSARVKMFFKPGDLQTAKYVSEHLGEVKDLWGEKMPLATPQELMGPDYKDYQVVIARDAPPIKSRMRLKYQDQELQKWEQTHRVFWDQQDDRKDMSGRLTRS